MRYSFSPGMLCAQLPRITCLFTDISGTIFIGPLTGPIDCPETSVATKLRPVASQKIEHVTAGTAAYRV